MEDKKVFHNGQYIDMSVLIGLLDKEPNYIVASSYRESLLVYALQHDDYEIINIINKNREKHNYPIYPTTSYAPASEHNMPKRFDEAEKCRGIYRRLNDEQRIELLKESLSELVKNSPRLFDKQQCWIGIFLVIRDRLDGKLKASSFHKLAEKITPENLANEKKISKNTMSNLSRIINAEDRNEAYYDMGENPFTELCDKYWDIVRGKILTNF